jgi:hypothetical protein
MHFHAFFGGIAMAKVIKAFPGVPDGKIDPVDFAPGDEVVGDLARVAIAEGWAEGAVAIEGNKAPSAGAGNGGGDGDRDGIPDELEGLSWPQLQAEIKRRTGTRPKNKGEAIKLLSGAA